eukprot:1464999-Rhodomonas_salina.3
MQEIVEVVLVPGLAVSRRGSFGIGGSMTQSGASCPRWHQQGVCVIGAQPPFHVSINIHLTPKVGRACRDCRNVAAAAGLHHKLACVCGALCAAGCGQGSCHLNGGALPPDESAGRSHKVQPHALRALPQP